MGWRCGSIRHAPLGQRDSLYLQAELRQRMIADNYRQQSRNIDRENAQVSNQQRLITPGGRAPISFYCLTMTFCSLTITSMPELKPPGTALAMAFCISGGLPRFTCSVRDIARLRHKTEARRERT